MSHGFSLCHVDVLTSRYGKVKPDQILAINPKSVQATDLPQKNKTRLKGKEKCHRGLSLFMFVLQPCVFPAGEAVMLGLHTV